MSALRVPRACPRRPGARRLLERPLRLRLLRALRAGVPRRRRLQRRRRGGVSAQETRRVRGQHYREPQKPQETASLVTSEFGRGERDVILRATLVR